MRSATVVFALAAVSGALAQLPPQLQSFVGNLSSSCQQTVLQLALSGDFSSCLKVPQALPILTQALPASNTTSLVPYVDQFVALECATSGCSNATLTSTFTTLSSGCATDLKQYNISNATLRAVFQQYPLAREVVCLQTVMPFNATTNSTGSSGSSSNATYCATSLLNQVQAIVGTNLSVDFFTSLASSAISATTNSTMGMNMTTSTNMSMGTNVTSNSTLAQLGQRFNTSLICNDCIFAAADVIGVAYPSIANLTLRSLGLGRTVTGNATIGNVTYSANTTLSAALNNTCSPRGLNYTSNGTLPSTIRLGAVNSTFGYNLTAGNGTRQAPANTTPIRRNVADIKARWIGQQL